MMPLHITEEGEEIIALKRRIERLEANDASLRQAFDEMKELAAQRLQVMREQEAEIERLKLTPPDRREDLRCVISDLCAQVREAERQRDELLAVLEEVRKCKSLYSMWRGRNKSRTYGAIIDAAIAAIREQES